MRQSSFQPDDREWFRCQCRADKILLMDEDTMTSLVYSHLLETLQLALAAVILVDLPAASTLKKLMELQQTLEDLEVSTAMLLNRAGVSWDQMATTLGVRRQSLNRRLSRRVTRLEGEPQNLPSLEADWPVLLSRLSEEVEEIAKMKPRQIAHTRARRMLSGQEIPEVFG